MWEWSRTVTEYAAAAAWMRTEQTEAKYVDPEYWAESVEGESAEGDGVAMAAGDRIGVYDLVG
ncbi:hypothetical protein AB4305_09800 [Nocardia sp. 2YAB30]|uniref:hypothetical protein n=1 Tax=unclassified Nocardia TaxID=2637762 RepID=UPI003F9C34F2